MNRPLDIVFAESSSAQAPFQYLHPLSVSPKQTIRLHDGVKHVAEKCHIDYFGKLSTKRCLVHASAHTFFRYTVVAEPSQLSSQFPCRYTS